MAVQGEKVLGFTWNVPNALTLLRLVFVPVLVVVFLLHPQDPAGRLVATGIFVMAVLTDSLDGHIARKYNMVTDFGKIWDSIVLQVQNLKQGSDDHNRSSPAIHEIQRPFSVLGRKKHFDPVLIPSIFSHNFF